MTLSGTCCSVCVLDQCCNLLYVFTGSCSKKSLSYLAKQPTSEGHNCDEQYPAEPIASSAAGSTSIACVV